MDFYGYFNYFQANKNKPTNPINPVGAEIQCWPGKQRHCGNQNEVIAVPKRTLTATAVAGEGKGKIP